MVEKANILKEKTDLGISLFADVDLCFPETAVFIKEEVYEGKCFWGIYDSDGERLAVTKDRECAFVLARQHDLEPQSAH